MTAGNVVLVQQPSDTTSVGMLLARVLVTALSAETFAYVDEDPFDTRFRQVYGISFEGKSVPDTVPTSRRISCPNSRVAAVVDRSGNAEVAANALVSARFSFGGSSSYAPTLVLVNEFTVKGFSQAAVTAASRYSALASRAEAMSHKSDFESSRDKSAILPEHETVLISGDYGSIVLLPLNTILPDCTRSDAPTLFVLPVSSMDAAIDILNQSDSPLAAHYVYAAPAAAKYITQFVRSAASFVNHIPAELLVGGLNPTGWQLSAHPRYTPEMFSQPSPITVSDSTLSTNITRLISASKAQERERLEATLTSVFKPVKEPWGPMFGFFEQGFLFNASVILTSVVVGTVCGIKYGYPALLQSL
jgi:acyl-CoA reductase-like NAD-dependent aldehyde dehydrogenase